ncbi:hypothetical protein HMPREF9140_01384 [Prevotella micans F0438]|uniref:Uncharacterized protein n=1 Tax=Prevotella micans F0438 TaxID=883158 RepID=H1Q396_9BACT|nr:hypothetical protein HMPREF9140_01384 [Prevotella micans F0438]
MCVLVQLMRVLAQLMFSSSIDVFVIPIQSNSGCRPACRDRPRVCPSPLLVVFVRFHDPTRMLLVVFCLPPTPTRATDCITHIGFIKSHMPSVRRTEGVILSDRHGVCPYTCGLQPELALGLDFGVPFRYLISNSRDFLVRQTKIKTADSFLWESTVGVRGGS